MFVQRMSPPLALSRHGLVRRPRPLSGARAEKMLARIRKKVLQSGRNLLNHLEMKKRSFESNPLMRLKYVELPKLHTRVRFPSPAPLYRCPLLRSLSGVKWTWVGALHMSASDPKRTAGGPLPAH